MGVGPPATLNMVLLYPKRSGKEADMFAVLYRWRAKENKEDEFRDAWHRATEAIYRHKGSLGSRLMRSQDGDFYALAQWPTRDHWRARSQPTEADPTASQQMRDAIEYAHPPVELEVADDLLRDEAYDIQG